MKRRTFAALLCAAGLSSAGCSLGGRAQTQPVTVSLWHVYGAQTDSPLNDLVEEFNATAGKDLGVRVEVTMVSNNNNIHKDILAAANHEPGATQLPDIFVAYPKTVLAMPDASVLVDYFERLDPSEIDAFVPSFVEDGTVGGRLTCLPVAKSTELLFVNKTAFDRFSAATGVQVEDLQTWEGLYGAASAYAAWVKQETPFPAGDKATFFVHDFHFNYFQVGVESMGGTFFESDGTLAFDECFERAWKPYAQAAIEGGIWLQGGYATEPLRTGEAIVSVASSASVLYFSNEVIYADNTTENVEIISRPCPVFEGAEHMVMQRGAGMCTVRSTPDREQAALDFLRWLVEPEHNTRFVIQTGYMPVTDEAFEDHLPGAIESLDEQMYAEVYRAYVATRDTYDFYTAPQFETYLGTETAFESDVRRILLAARNAYVKAGENDHELLEQLVEDSYSQLKTAMGS